MCHRGVAGFYSANVGAGPGKGVDVKSMRRWATVAAVAVVLVAAVVAALAFTAAPVSAYSTWAHNGAQGCVCHDQGRDKPTDASCTSCHASYPDETCWSCHEPRQAHRRPLHAELGVQPGMPPLEPHPEAVHHAVHAR